MNARKASQTAIDILRAWATRSQVTDLGSVYVFGSAINAGGSQFVRKASDLDILIVVDESNIKGSLGLVEATERLLSIRKELESELQQGLQRESASATIASTLLVTSQEVRLDIHKTTPEGFFGRSDFFEVMKNSKGPFEDFISFDRTRARGALACIAAAQKSRHLYLSISANGTRSAAEWDSVEEPLPKEICREAAQLRFCTEDLNDRSEFDTNRGLDFLSILIDRAAKTEPRLNELREWFSIRRGGKGDRTPLSPRDHMILYEILRQEAQKWLLDFIRSKSKKTQDLGALRRVAVIATTEDLAAERLAVAEYLKRTPGIRDVREIRAEEEGVLEGLAADVLRVVLLGWRTGGTTTLNSAISVKDNLITIATRAIPAEHLEIDELTKIVALRKACGPIQTFTGIEEAVAAAQEQVAEWLARKSPNNPAERINLHPWESTYLRQRLPTWEQGHHGPLQARRSKNQRLDRTQLYVSLRVESDFCFEDEKGKLIILPPDKETYVRAETVQRSLFHDEHKRKATFLERAISQPSLPYLVIEGEAGSGKTVLLQHIAFTLGNYHLARPLPPHALELETLAQGRPLVPIPLFLEARVLAEILAELDGVAGLSTALLGEIAKATGQNLQPNDIIDGLRAGRYVVLIDSLDEVPSQDGRDSVARCLAGVSEQEWSSTFVLTTRPTAYTGSVTFGGRLRKIRIAHLDFISVRMMVERWSVFHGYGAGEQEALLAAVNEVAARHGGANMAENPLLLTVTMLVYDQQERLPDSTADLYKRIVEILCETRKSDITPATRRQLLELIFEGAQRAKSTAWGVEEAVEWLRQSRADVFATADSARAMLDRLGNETGLLLFESRSRRGAIPPANRRSKLGSSPRSSSGAGRVVLRPWHRSFQEYLAACRLASGVESVSTETDRLFEPQNGEAPIVEDPAWEGVLRFLVGVYGDQGVDRAKAYIERLHDHVAGQREASITSRPGRVLGLVASGLTEYQEYFRLSSLRSTVRSELFKEFEESGSTWPLVDRLLALEALGRLNDPRLKKQKWIEILGGTVTVVSGPDRDRQATRYARVKVEPFQILWSPVTVRDFKAFVKNGYAQKKWWDNGLFVALEAEEEDYSANADMLSDIQIEDSEKEFRPTAPANWARQIHHPNHPVVGVSWYEARAFCRWATVNWKSLPAGYVVDLPTESEWHCAAFGSTDDPHPWGSQPLGESDHARASYIRGGAPDVATPVGAFPLGNRNGIVDLVGNVWEWCSEINQSRGEHKPRRSPEGLGPMGVLKGGCGHGRPDGRDRRGEVMLASRLPCHGFRVVLRPVRLESGRKPSGK